MLPQLTSPRTSTSVCRLIPFAPSASNRHVALNLAAEASTALSLTHTAERGCATSDVCRDPRTLSTCLSCCLHSYLGHFERAHEISLSLYPQIVGFQKPNAACSERIQVNATLETVPSLIFHHIHTARTLRTKRHRGHSTQYIVQLPLRRCCEVSCDATVQHVAILKVILKHESSACRSPCAGYCAQSLSTFFF